MIFPIYVLIFYIYRWDVTMGVNNLRVLELVCEVQYSCKEPHG